MITIKQFMVLKYLVGRSYFGEELREYLKEDNLELTYHAFYQIAAKLVLMKLITSKRNYYQHNGKCKFKLTRKGWKEYIKFYSMVIKDV